MATETFAGPVDYLVVAFPEHASVGSGLEQVLIQVGTGQIELLDLEIIGRDNNGAPLQLSLSDVQDSTETDLSVFDGATSGILDEDDRATIATALTPGQFAIAIVYEDRSLATAVTAWSQAGGVELFTGGVDIDDLEHALEEGIRT